MGEQTNLINRAIDNVRNSVVVLTADVRRAERRIEETDSRSTKLFSDSTDNIRQLSQDLETLRQDFRQDKLDSATSRFSLSTRVDKLYTLAASALNNMDSAPSSPAPTGDFKDEILSSLHSS